MIFRIAMIDQRVAHCAHGSFSFLLSVSEVMSAFASPLAETTCFNCDGLRHAHAAASSKLQHAEQQLRERSASRELVTVIDELLSAVECSQQETAALRSENAALVKQLADAAAVVENHSQQLQVAASRMKRAAAAPAATESPEPCEPTGAMLPLGLGSRKSKNAAPQRHSSLLSASPLPTNESASPPPTPGPNGFLHSQFVDIDPRYLKNPFAMPSPGPASSEGVATGVQATAAPLAPCVTLAAARWRRGR
jgi:hypothetical protein